MSVPSPDKLTVAYLRDQFERIVRTAQKISQRVSISGGRVVPDAADITIHNGRYLEATVMFLDISRFSQRDAWTQQEQKSLLNALSLFFSEMIKIVEDYGGVVEKNTGDGIMAYFTRQPGDAYTAQQRGIAAALTMFSASELMLNPIIKSWGIEPLEFRICLDHGPVTIAKVGAPRRFNGIVAIGATANIASKLLSIARPNSILVGGKVLEGLPPSWRHSFVKLETLNTGWYFRISGTPYACWEYTGRWVLPNNE